MASTRLPGKVLRPVADRPALELLLERMARAEQLDDIAVATSEEPWDDAIERHCTEHGVACVRGPHEDVLGRFVAAARRRELDAVVRVNGDSPLLDPALVDRGVRLARRREPDVATNVFPRSFPIGQSVEVISRATLEQLDTAAEDEREREHVTVYVYDNPTSFDIASFTRDDDRSALVLALDGPADADRVDRLVAAMPGCPAGWTLDELLACVDRLGLGPR